MDAETDISPTKRSLSRLRLTFFRNYTTAALDPDQRHIVLTGENGAGKTNILEAISYLSPGRGMRREPYDQVASISGEGDWAVAATVETPTGPVDIGTGWQAGSTNVRSRQIRINQTPAKSAEALSDHLRILWLTPAMDGLFTASGTERRQFLDRLVLTLNPDHGKQVSGFADAMRQRNRLLAEGGRDPVWLDAIEALMAQTGSAVYFARQECVAFLAQTLEKTFEPNSPFPRSQLYLEGPLEDMAFQNASQLEDAYQTLLREHRREDMQAGRALLGPHKSDLKVRHAQKNMAAAQCSTGEQKGLLMGLILAHAHLVRDMSGITPILLLDEVAAHLDATRRVALFEILDGLGTQCWMTGTDKSMFDSLGDKAQFVHVENGTLTR